MPVLIPGQLQSSDSAGAEDETELAGSQEQSSQEDEPIDCHQCGVRQSCVNFLIDDLNGSELWGALCWTCRQEKEQHMPEVSAGSSLRPSAVGAESIVTTALRAGVRAVILEAGDDAGSLTYRMVRQALEGRGGLGSLEDRKADIKAAMQDEWSLVTAEQSAAGNISVDGLDSMQSTSDDGGEKKNWLTTFDPELGKLPPPHKRPGPASGQGGRPKKERGEKEARHSSVTGAQARNANQANLQREQAKARAAELAEATARRAEADAEAEARRAQAVVDRLSQQAAAEADERVRVAAALARQEKATSATLQSVRAMLQGLIDSRATITPHQQEELSAVRRRA